MPYSDLSSQQRAQNVWVKNNREKVNAIKQRIRKRNTDLVKALKRDKPCADCGEKYPPHVMEFDHVRGVKVARVASLANQAVTVQKILDEVAKCELVCANCHRERTFVQGWLTTQKVGDTGVSL